MHKTYLEKGKNYQKHVETFRNILYFITDFYRLATNVLYQGECTFNKCYILPLGLQTADSPCGYTLAT